MKLNFNSTRNFIAILLPAIAVAAFVTIAPFSNEADSQTSPPMPKTPPALKLNDPLPGNLFTELAKALNPTVVNIQTSTMPKQMRRGFRDPLFDMLEQMYGMQMMPNLVMPQQKPSQSLGTGFIIREDGLIITNNHVIEGADVINVQINEGSNKTYEAKVIGRDGRTDIALIKIDTGTKLPVAVLGSSKDVEVGEWVAAFGNPFGHGHTMTKGIISAKGRALDDINKFPFLQTDAGINPGNSGGPLVNSKGLVIGVNTAIDPRAQAIGFAIPIDDVKSIIPELERNGSIKKAFLGVGLGDLDPQSATYLGLKNLDGSIVVNVEKGGPADRAGIRVYDVIVEFNGKAIKSTQELMNAVADASLSKEASIKYIREGKERKASVNLVERTEERTRLFQSKREAPAPAPQGEKDSLNFGLKVADLNPKLRQDYNIDDSIPNRPIVVEVGIDSPALRSGLRQGDLVLDVNRREVSSAKDVVRSLKKGTNTIRIARGDTIRIFVIASE
jgi:serine protease Do